MVKKKVGRKYCFSSREVCRLLNIDREWLMILSERSRLTYYEPSGRHKSMSKHSNYCYTPAEIMKMQRFLNRFRRRTTLPVARPFTSYRKNKLAFR